MTAALKNWWNKWVGYTFVEKDNGLYPSRIQLPRYVYFSPALLPLNSIIGNYCGEYWVLLIVLLVPLLVREIERYRFGPLGRPIVRVDQDSLTLARFNNLWPPQIKITLSTLRALHMGDTVVERPYNVIELVCFEQMDGIAITTRVSYDATTKAAVIDFLRRKLPASVDFTAGEPAPLAGHGDSVESKPL